MRPIDGDALRDKLLNRPPYKALMYASAVAKMVDEMPTLNMPTESIDSTSQKVIMCRVFEGMTTEEVLESLLREEEDNNRR